MSPDKIPIEVLGRFPGPGNVGDLLFGIASDLALAGRPCRRWILVTSRELAVVEGDGGSEAVERLELAAVEKIRAESAVGSGLLQVRVAGSWRDLTRYSNRLSTRFNRFVSQVERYKETGEAVPGPADEEDDPGFCPGCDRPLLSRGDVCPWCMDVGTLLRWVSDLLRPHAGSCLLLMGLMLAGIAANLIPPKLQQYLVDDVLRDDQPATALTSLSGVLVGIVAALASVTIFNDLLRYLRSRLSNRVGTTLTTELQGRMIAKLQERTVAYHDHHEAGILRTRVAYDAQCIQGVLHQLTGGLLLQFLQVIGIGVMLFTLHPRLAVLTLLPAPLVLWLGRRYWTHVLPRYYHLWFAMDRQSIALGNMLSGMRIVKSFTQEPREYRRFRDVTGGLRKARVGVSDANVAYSIQTHLAFSMGGLLIWYAGGGEVLRGTMTLGELMAFLAYLGMFYSPLEALADVTSWATDFLTSAQRVFDILHGPAETETVPETGKIQVRGEVRFEDLSFGYDVHKLALRNVSFTVAAGETVGIVGKSGSGKTTLVNLLCRFYEPKDGRILIDGHDIRELPPSGLRRHIGVVLQEPFLFHGTLWENLVYGRPDISIEEGLRSAYAANVHEFVVRKPFGYESRVGAKGQGLSGGERQRLSLARALLYDPRILILDEATSSVDVETEKAIQDALYLISRGRTVLAIAHRLSTLRNADRILVFDGGELVESGTQRELLDRGGRYARMVRLQTQLTRKATIDELTGSEAGDSLPGAEPAADPLGDPEPPAGSLPDPAEFTPRWLDANEVRIEPTPWGGARLVEPDGTLRDGLQARRLFPASRPTSQLSLAATDAEGQAKEIGLIADLSDWPDGARRLIEESLARRYFIQEIETIRSARETFGFLILEVVTSRGPAEIVIAWSRDAAQDYGRNGLLVEDAARSQYLIPDLDRLSDRERDLVERFLYR